MCLYLFEGNSSAFSQIYGNFAHTFAYFARNPTIPVITVVKTFIQLIIFFFGM